MMIYRRIEFKDKITNKYNGLLSIQDNDIVNCWFDYLTGFGLLYENIGKYFFTECGWNKIGKKIITICDQKNYQYKIIETKNKPIIKNNYEAIILDDIFYKN